jgi:porin
MESLPMRERGLKQVHFLDFRGHYFTPTDKDEIFAKFGFAGGNGLNEKSPFLLAPWAADLEGDVKDINGRSRDYLLTAWYKHTLQFAEDLTLALTGGIVDATESALRVEPQY